MFKSSIRKMTRADTEICQNTLRLNFCYYLRNGTGPLVYYIPITNTTLELSVFWPSDTESRINELRFSESISLSFKNEANVGYLLLRRRYVK